MERMNLSARWIVLTFTTLGAVAGCGGGHTPQYGTESSLTLWTARRQVWAVAPAVNLSGQSSVDPLLQADLVYEQLQAVRGITVIPVNRVAQVYASLRLDKVDSAQQAAVVCDLLGCDGLVVPTVTDFDPYAPPKFGGSLQLFGKPRGFAVPENVDPRDLVRSPTPPAQATLAAQQQDITTGGAFLQSVGMFDAANGSVRRAVLDYAVGRNDPTGPLGSKEYFVSMDRYCGFAYHALIAELVEKAADSPRRQMMSGRRESSPNGFGDSPNESPRTGSDRLSDGR
jgi:hypothetical protein